MYLYNVRDKQTHVNTKKMGSYDDYKTANPFDEQDEYERREALFEAQENEYDNREKE